ncbi:DDE_3 domain-containing protein [Trichonephila clavipes]|nr:DDE_3 domain-containing protein [Trichonephila clavipes]
MSQRRRLPNSLRWRAVGWMEMGLSQADAARRLNVRPVPGRPRATTPAEDRFLALSARRRRTTTVPQLVADHFQASGRRISATTVRNRLHNAVSVCKKTSCVRSLNGRQRREPLYAGQENMFLGRSNNGLLCCSQTSPDLQWRVIQGISDEIPDPYVRPYAAAIGNDFILMDDNARPHRARIVEEYLEDHGLERMEWPARSPDLNPIEHLLGLSWQRGCCFKSSSAVVT